MAPRAPLDPLTGLEAARFGVYVHFPYCLSKCPYCDFASTAARTIPDERYTAAILAELEGRLEAQQLTGREVTSIFIGGGTPSLWAPASVAKVLEALRSKLRVAEGCEVTLEANPGASDAGRFADYRAAGVNRLSMPDAATAFAATGYERGTITPFGSTTAWPVIADERMLGRTVAFGAGAHGVAAVLAADDVVRVLAATVADVTDPESETRSAS